jgi:hypothetical protein
MFYLDCFIESDKNFPVNSYYDEDPERLAKAGAALLKINISGITGIRISKETKGMSPIKLEGDK